MSKQCGFKDLVPGKQYYRVCCGDIIKIEFVRDLDGESFEFKYYNSGDHVYTGYYSDSGVWDAPKCSYKNDLNCIHLDVDSAIDHINDPKYRRDLREHRLRMIDLAEMQDFGSWRMSW